MRTHLLRLIPFLALLVASCGVTSPVRVLDEGQSAVSLSLGGPLVSLGGVVFPVPYLNAGYAYGVTDTWTTQANLHVTSLLFNDLGLDAGAAARLVRERGLVPEVTVKLQGLFFTTFSPGAHSLFLANANVNASYAIGKRTFVYAGAEQTYQFSPSSYFISPLAGIQLPLSSVIDLQIESKWMAANRFTGHGLLEGFGSIGDAGSIGLFFGVQYALGGRGAR
jgi:hypothetical protein